MRAGNGDGMNRISLPQIQPTAPFDEDQQADRRDHDRQDVAAPLDRPDRDELEPRCRRRTRSQA